MLLNDAIKNLEQAAEDDASTTRLLKESVSTLAAYLVEMLPDAEDEEGYYLPSVSATRYRLAYDGCLFVESNQLPWDLDNVASVKVSRAAALLFAKDLQAGLVEKWTNWLRNRAAANTHSRRVVDAAMEPKPDA